MTVEKFLEYYLETELDPISVSDEYTDDSYEEIREACPDVFLAENGTVYYDNYSMCAYYNLFDEPKDCFHFVEIYDDEDDFDDEDLDDLDEVNYA